MAEKPASVSNDLMRVCACMAGVIRSAEISAFKNLFQMEEEAQRRLPASLALCDSPPHAH